MKCGHYSAQSGIDRQKIGEARRSQDTARPLTSIDDAPPTVVVAVSFGRLPNWQLRGYENGGEKSASAPALFLCVVGAVKQIDHGHRSRRSTLLLETV